MSVRILTDEIEIIVNVSAQQASKLVGLKEIISLLLQRIALRLSLHIVIINEPVTTKGLR
jgi:hypothetical protein